jgi:hypothetical protein
MAPKPSFPHTRPWQQQQQQEEEGKNKKTSLRVKAYMNLRVSEVNRKSIFAFQK